MLAAGSRPVSMWVALALAASAIPCSPVCAAGNRLGVWGWHAAAWTGLLQKEFQVQATALTDAAKPERIPVEQFTGCRAVFLGQGQPTPGTVADLVTLRQYLSQGGVVVFFTGTVTGLLQGTTVYDLARAADVVGAGAYAYGEMVPKVTDPANALLADCDPAALLPLFTGRLPMLADLSGGRVILGTDTAAALLLNRYGRGLVVFISPILIDQLAAGAGATPAGTAARAVLGNLVRAILAPADTGLDRLCPVQPDAKVFRVANVARRAVILAGAKDLAAAREFARVVQRATGTRLYLNLSPAADDLCIHIGRTPFVEQAGLDLDRLPPFAYHLRLVDRQNLVLAGREERATEYAAVDFLRRFCGYRVFLPSELGEIVPHRAVIEVPLGLNRREVPSIPSYTVAWGEMKGFCRNSRTTLLASHWLMNVYPPERYAQTHPEYYPLIDGKRFVPDPKLGGTWQPCVSHPDLPAIAVAYARDWFANTPLALGFSVGVNDGGGDCQCPECLAARARYGNQYIPFYNEIGRRLARECPDKLVCFIAYGRGAAPVPHDTRIEPNLQVEITTGLKRDMELLARWHAAGARNLGTYEYFYGGGYVVPRHYPHIMGKAWRKAFHRYSLQSIWQELYPAVPLYDGARQYVLDQLAWNMDADIDALLDDYFSNMYAEAAGPMREFFDRIEQVYGRKPDPLDPMADWKSVAQLEEYTWEDWFFLRDRLGEAAKAVKNPDAARRLALLSRLYFGLTHHYIEGYLCGKELRSMTEVKERGGAQDVLVLDLKAKDVHSALEFARRGVAVTAAIEGFTMSEDEQKQVFASGGLDDYRNEPTLKIGPFVEVQADRVFGLVTRYLETQDGWNRTRMFWCTAADQGIARAFTEDLPAQQPPDAFRALCLTQVYLHDGPEAQKNLMSSPGFEPDDQAPAPAPSELKAQDWASLDRRLPGWSTWHFQQSITRFHWDPTEAHSGRYSLAVRENQIAGCFQTVVPVTPGCRYRLSFWVKQTPPDRGGALSVRWQGPKGWADEGASAVPRLTVPYPSGRVAEWRQVQTYFTAPPGVTHCLPLFGAPQQTPQEGTWFDDVSLVQVYDPAYFRR